jgi:50S ribosomal protein L16 3-hydroxylase
MQLNHLNWEDFLQNYWQKKPMVIKNALPADLLASWISPEELAGLAMEEEVESRIVIEKAGATPWELKRGPFTEEDFTSTPDTHWTLLVQGVNHWLPETAELLTAFDAIPRWRLDDVMVSFAPEEGGVGPHYDHYDVFLIQGAGKREWRLTTQGCTPDNYLPDMALRLMAEFETEETHLLEAGDILYLPAKVGHWGISRSQDCMTWSVGYRSLSGREMLEHFADFAARESLPIQWYQDPQWSSSQVPANISGEAVAQAKVALYAMLEDEATLHRWFGQFVTEPQGHQGSLLSLPPERSLPRERFLRRLKQGEGLSADLMSRWAQDRSQTPRLLHINGETTQIESEVEQSLLDRLCSHFDHPSEDLMPWLSQVANLDLLHGLWQAGVLHWSDVSDAS